MSRHRACSLADVPDGGAHKVDVEGTPIAVVHIGDEVYAVGDICSHQRISLSEGEVDASSLEIECWKHGSCFSLVTGQPSSLPANKPVPTYEVAVEGDDVYVEVSG